jgi:hypothetical protein
MSNEKTLLTEAELAERWDTSVYVLRRVRATGKGPAVHIKGTVPVSYSLEAIKAFEDGGLITVTQLAERWGITRRGVEKRAASGKLPEPVMLGSSKRYQFNKILAVEGVV